MERQTVPVGLGGHVSLLITRNKDPELLISALCQHPGFPEAMKTAVLTMVLLLLLSQVIPGSHVAEAGLEFTGALKNAGSLLVSAVRSASGKRSSTSSAGMAACAV
ncbi:beta-defensin 27 isoform X1 [Rattus norvegicus]|uniref:beta-defensin 27 isoform X1 n=1 Tax=Rattus norvegicus TaxID=10116 RepID=UPI002FD7B253